MVAAGGGQLSLGHVAVTDTSAASNPTNPNPNRTKVQRLFDVMGADQVLRIHTTLAAARTT
ncbi:hypothetical protein [Streptomyces sp. NPDC088727]|uniref:hypothetical protein n=1 Tax=Streptomyces sp. NPDC088727 TaxID=3365875 RepID=UPI00381F17DF